MITLIPTRGAITIDKEWMSRGELRLGNLDNEYDGQKQSLFKADHICHMLKACQYMMAFMLTANQLVLREGRWQV